jgi:hypothetical protein
MIQWGEMEVLREGRVVRELRAGVDHVLKAPGPVVMARLSGRNHGHQEHVVHPGRFVPSGYGVVVFRMVGQPVQVQLGRAFLY